MKAFNIRQLKDNPSAALRSAKEEDLVVIMNRDDPEALLIDLKRLGGLPDVSQVRVVLAVALFKQGHISLGYAARIADKTLPDMITLLVKLGIPVVTVTKADVEHDLQVVDHVWA